MRPPAITVTTWIMTAFNWLGPSLALGVSQHRALLLGAYLFLVSVGQVVLWFYAFGYNWARILVLITSFLTFWNVYSLIHYHPWTRPLPIPVLVVRVVMVVGEALVGVYLVFYLNSREAKRYFLQERESAETVRDLSA